MVTTFRMGFADVEIETSVRIAHNGNTADAATNIVKARDANMTAMGSIC
jgi:hypothetical protein